MLHNISWLHNVCTNGRTIEQVLELKLPKTMRRTRTRSQRVPLQTISVVNSEKMRKETPPKTSFASKKGTDDLHSSSLCKEEATSDSKQLLNDVTVASTGDSTACSPRKSRKRPLSPSKEGQPSKLLKEEAVDEDSLDSEEELDYEQMREKNLRDNEAFFASLGISKAKEELKLTTKKYPKVISKREPKKREVLPRRKSLRIQRIDPTGQPLPPEPEPEPIENEHPRVPSGPVKMIDVIENEEEDHSTFTGSLSDLTPDSCEHKPLSSDLQSFVNSMKKMHIATKAKVCKDRLFSVAIHPTSDRVLAMAGDKWGRLGFWDVSAEDQDKSVVTYRPHSRPIGHITIRPADPLTVYTCSYDSTLRCGHIEKGIFDELYSVPEEQDDLFRSFDFLSPTSMVLAQFRGDVAVLDTRTPGQKAEKLYPVCDKYLRTVSVHPTNSNFFITAGTDMKVSLWDLRKLNAKGNKPLHTMTHGRAVSSAYFSPVTGSHILTCCADDTLNVYSCSSSCGEVALSKSISHNNKTGRWLTPFRSVWHPSREDVFFVGSMKTPRRMEAFGLDGRLLHEFQGDVLSSVCSVVNFHPSRNILVGGNSSGYIFPFM